MALSQQQLSSAPYNQSHLFEGASADVCASIVSQLNEVDSKLAGGGLQGYLERARVLLRDAQKGVNPFDGLTPMVPEGRKLTGDSGPGTEKYAKLERLGAEEVSKCAFVLVAGGLGERLGYPGIKIGITAEVTSGVTFMETYARFLLAFQDHARRSSGSQSLTLPLAIMTSGDTHQKTLELLDDNNYFGLSRNQVTLMKQELVPALLDIEARIAAKNGHIETKPHGHGDVHSLLHQNGLPKQWLKEGRKWLLLFQDTNPLPFRSLCAVLGVSAESNFAMNSVAVPRLPKEAVGGICMLQNKAQGTTLTINVEYNQLEPLLKGTPAGGDVADTSGFSPYPGNINVLVLGLGALDRCLEKTGGVIPEFVNPKWADDAKTSFKSPTRLECMMQEFPRLCEGSDRIGFSQLDRWISFTCVKNNLQDAKTKNPADCALSAEADIYSCNQRLLELAGADVKVGAPGEVDFLGIKANVGARIILQPSFAISLEQLKEKVKGKVRISSRSSLILDGDITIDGLDLDGALEIAGDGIVKDTVVRNAGQVLEAIPAQELHSSEASYQIRGYRVSRGEVERVQLPRRVMTKGESGVEKLAKPSKNGLGCYSWCR